MSQKLLQKSRNRYLQQSLPENLIPNKRINRGKIFRFRPKRAVFQSYSHMEKEMCNQWLFSWNTFKEESTVQPVLEKKEKEKVLLHIWLQWLPEIKFPRKTLITPTLHTLKHGISRAVGGNIVEHLNQYVNHSNIPGKPGNSSQGVKALDSTDSPNVNQYSTDESNSSLNRLSYCIQGRTGVTAADLVYKQLSEKFFYSIYSLNEKTRLATRRNKVNDEYKNRLTECRKVAILYGNLPKKTLIQAMRNAKKRGGSIDSNFLSFLEKRLDIALKRASFFFTIKSARQWIERGKVLVNDQRITISSYQLQPGDVIRVAPKARASWKKECWNLFTKIRGNMPRERHLGRLTRKSVTSENQGFTQKHGNTFSPLTLNPTSEKHLVVHKRRFPFSPALMRKWKEWTTLWANCTDSKKKAHKWDTPKKQRFLSATPQKELPYFFFFTSSALADYLAMINRGQSLRIPCLQLANRGHTTVSELLLWKKAGSPSSLHHRGNKERGLPTLSQTSSLIYGDAHWLHHQQSHVVDGLYPYRWNRVLARKKDLAQKTHDWRHNCNKPLHLECSYALGTAVFLYAPQKLTWPSNINGSLLQKALAG